MADITSKNNAKIIFAKKLLEKKYRDRENLFIAETEKVIEEAVKAGLVLHEAYILQDKHFEILKKYKNVFLKTKVFKLTENVFKELSSTMSPDGIVAVFEKKVQEKVYGGGNFLILDCVQNPDNMGAIFRTAAASNFGQIFTINSVDKYNPKVLRASMGNQFKLNIVEIDYNDIQALFKNAKIYSMDMSGQDLFKMSNFDKNAGFVIGNEGNGLSKQIKELVKNYIKIPMGNGVESLNASISASIVMYYIYSKNLT